MNLLSYNILGGFHFDEIRKNLDFEKYDVICFQEFPMDCSIDKYFTNFHINKHTTLILKKQQKELGLALLYKKDKYNLSEYKRIELIKPPMKFIFRQYLKMVVSDDNSKNRTIKCYELTNLGNIEKYLMVNTHLYWEGNIDYLNYQLNEILNTIGDYEGKIILCGDLNTTNDKKRNFLKKFFISNGFTETKKNQKGTFEYFTKFNLPKDPFHKTKKLFSKIPPIRKLGTKEFDYIFLKNLNCEVNVFVQKINGSDHFPLTINIPA
ncbi:endonuclease/exonuclease/phosphatase family protein [Candidatus Dojkabacteria bacterium]|nr:endonuclease/exonuclease/phosphatase family protein [Candidatus Dojkabacteria bacterium]